MIPSDLYDHEENSFYDRSTGTCLVHTRTGLQTLKGAPRPEKLFAWWQIWRDRLFDFFFARVHGVVRCQNDTTSHAAPTVYCTRTMSWLRVNYCQHCPGGIKLKINLVRRLSTSWNQSDGVRSVEWSVSHESGSLMQTSGLNATYRRVLGWWFRILCRLMPGCGENVIHLSHL